MENARPPTLKSLLDPPQRLDVWCAWPGCRHRVLMDPWEACWLLGPDTPLAGIARRFRCQACGTKGAEWIGVKPAIEDFYDQRHGNGLFAPGQPWARWAATASGS